MSYKGNYNLKYLQTIQSIILTSGQSLQGSTLGNRLYESALT